ncbi:SRPBCC domain-containing protein [Roseovarius sp. Pro17]|uniref:SRPBCC family protein n=1 Tax=Roseovarius sp. Pro17 TaxID=3108175 RepID=UPI002D79BB86|nr:SRPBCC domain-containing protein [Roseovarius sp. Pro17]
MSTLTLERTFPHPPEHVFSYLTEPKNLLKWWRPESMSMKEHNLDFSRPGPWSSTLINAEGGLHKMSGNVVAVDPPRSVEFTWGWHDDADQRGAESRVRFEVHPAKGGSLFRLIHSGLPSDESAQNHGKGWTSTLKKLERLLS